MKTIILPGYSAHNRAWAEEMAAALPNAEVHPWAHWETGGSLDVKAELAAILKRIGDDRVHLLAKSVGCRMAAHLIAHMPGQIGKAIFCGIPSVSEEAWAGFAAALAALPPERALVIQNAHDPYAGFAEVQHMIRALSPAVQVLERPRRDHHYPYPEDFRAFLEATKT